MPESLHKIKAEIATALEVVFFEPDWLIHAYYHPKLKHGITIFGEKSVTFGRARYALILINERKITVQFIPDSGRSNKYFEKIVEIVTEHSHNIPLELTR